MNPDKKRIISYSKHLLHNLRIYFEMKRRFEHYLSLHDSILYMFEKECATEKKKVDDIREYATKLKWVFKDDIHLGTLPKSEKLEEIRMDVIAFLKITDDFEDLIKEIVVRSGDVWPN